MDSLERIICFSILIFIMMAMNSCYKLEDPAHHFEDSYSTVVHDLPGDTLATDGWDDNFEDGDWYLRQRYYNSKWTDSIRFVSFGSRVINSADGINESSEDGIHWLTEDAIHPLTAGENDAYYNTSDGYHYIRRSNAWYQMEILGDRGRAANDSIFINWRGFVSSPPSNPQQGYAYRDNDNNRVYVYNGKAWELMVNDANYHDNTDFIQVEYSKSGKEAGKYSMFLFRFKDGWQQFIRDAADSLRYLKTDDWDIAFTGDLNSTVWLNNGQSKYGPATGSPLTKSSLIMYDYGYQFMDEAPEDEFFDNRPADQFQIGYTSLYGTGTNSWYELGSTFIAKPFPYRAYYLRLEQPDGSFRYGKLQLISMYKGAPEALTDRNWPSPYLTFRYFIQQDGSRNIKTKD